MSETELAADAAELDGAVRRVRRLFDTLPLAHQPEGSAEKSVTSPLTQRSAGGSRNRIGSVLSRWFTHNVVNGPTKKRLRPDPAAEQISNASCLAPWAAGGACGSRRLVITERNPLPCMYVTDAGERRANEYVTAVDRNAETVKYAGQSLLHDAEAEESAVGVKHGTLLGIG